MSTARGLRPLLAAAGVVLAAATALADPVLERVDATPSRGRRLVVVAEAAFEGRGELRVEGSVNGRTVMVRKRVRRAGTGRLRARVDARRLRLRRLSEPLTFDLRVVAEGTDGTRTERAVRHTVAVPAVVLPGLGNEQTVDPAAALVGALALAADGYTISGRDANLVLHGYPSLDGSLRSHARGLDRRVRKLLRGSPFARADVVGYSMGGLVARRWLADSGSRRARRVVFLGTPNQGAPLAHIAALGLQGDALAGLAELIAPELGDLGALTALLDGLLVTDRALETLRTFYPTYPWAFVTIEVPFLGSQRLAITPQLIESFGGLVPGLAGLPLDLESPLTPLNAVPPDARVEFFAVGYTRLVPEGAPVGLGTVDEVDLTGVLRGEGVDVATLASGEGDGLVPWRSLVLADTAGWRPAVPSTDLRAGAHVPPPADPRAVARIAQILAD
mgnify:CR=1 FL=1